MITLTLAAAFTAGLAGSAHCFGMCGGISAALSLRSRTEVGSARTTYLRTARHQTGRIGGYASVGAIGGTFGHSAHWMLSFTQFEFGLRIAAGVLTLLVALRILSRWNAFSAIERVGGRLWARLRPLACRASSVHSACNELVMGVLWGLLPCGLVYSALLMTLTTQSTFEGAALMLAFGLGTLPAVVFGGTISAVCSRFVGRQGFRVATGTAMLLFGVWLIVAAQFPHAMHAH